MCATCICGVEDVSVHICVCLLKHISALHNEQDRNANDLVFMMTSATENVDSTDGKSVRVA